jgi:hypothetical protein
MIRGTVYQAPKPAYKPGAYVKLKTFPLGLRFKVVSSSHTHTQLEGFKSAIANWELKLR